MTIDNKPFALMINLGDKDVHNMLLIVFRLRARLRMERSRDRLERMSMKDNTALIKNRAERKR